MEKQTRSETFSIIEYLRNRFLEKKRGNSSYSITAFARDLGVSQPYLSRLLTGERPPSVNFAMQTAAIFKIPQVTLDSWVADLAGIGRNSKISGKAREALTRKARTGATTIQYYELEKFKAISNWHHVAILNLTFAHDFKSNPIWIAKRLNISRLEAEDAIERLLALGLLARKAGKLTPTKNLLFVDTKHSDPSMREFHKQMSEKAIEALSDTSQAAYDARHIAGVTLAIDPARIAEFDEKIRQFQKEIIQMSVSKTYSEVYHLNLQFFPLTKRRST